MDFGTLSEHADVIALALAAYAYYRAKIVPALKERENEVRNVTQWKTRVDDRLAVLERESREYREDVRKMRDDIHEMDKKIDKLLRNGNGKH